MYCELMAEHEHKIAEPEQVARWHVVLQDQHAALCGQVLAHDAEPLSIADPRTASQREVCPVCRTRYAALS